MTYEVGAALEHDLFFRFQHLPDHRRDCHWSFLQLNVHHSSQEEAIGYLRVAYIPQGLGEAMNRERLLLVESKGYSIYPMPERLDEDITLFSDPSQHDSWKAQPRPAARYVMENVLRYGWNSWNDQLKGLTLEQMAEMVENHRPHLNKFTQPLIEKMFAFGVNKADVDYISVNDAWQGRGIAMAMYAGMARHLDEQHGLTLNASTTQTPSSQACWERMKAQGLLQAGTDGRLFYAAGVSDATLASRDIVPEPQPLPTKKHTRKSGPR